MSCWNIARLLMSCCYIARLVCILPHRLCGTSEVGLGSEGVGVVAPVKSLCVLAMPADLGQWFQRVGLFFVAACGVVSDCALIDCPSLAVCGAMTCGAYLWRCVCVVPSRVCVWCHLVSCPSLFSSSSVSLHALVCACGGARACGCVLWIGMCVVVAGD